MSATDPRSEIQFVLRLCQRCDLPESARVWAKNTLDAIEPIMRFVHYLQSNGYPIPDDVLQTGFKEIHLHACAWIAEEAEAEIIFRWEQEHGLR